MAICKCVAPSEHHPQCQQPVESDEDVLCGACKLCWDLCGECQPPPPPDPVPDLDDPPPGDAPPVEF
jgi:hypothetical protein